MTTLLLIVLPIICGITIAYFTMIFTIDAMIDFFLLGNYRKGGRR